MVKGFCGQCNTTKTQLLPNKGGGFFPLIMLAVSAAAAGSLTGGALSISNAVNKKTADKQLADKKRHSKAMEKKTATVSI